MKRSFLAVLLGGILSIGSLAASPAFADQTVIRVGYPGVGVDNQPYGYGDSVSLARVGNYLEDAFKNDPNIKVEWTFFRGAGPELNEALAAHQLDIAAGLGDLPSIVGRARGLKTKFLLPASEHGSLYLAVSPKSNVNSIDDLKGKKVAQFRGTNLQIATDAVLEAHHLTEKDVKFVSLTTADGLAALTSGNVDGSFGGEEYLDLQKRGIVKIVYASKKDLPIFGTNSAVFVTEDFEQAHPDLTQRVVTAFVKAAAWGSTEANRQQVFAAWAKAGVPVESFAEDFEGQTLARRNTAVIDDFIKARYQDKADKAKQYGLIKKDIDLNSWFEPKYLETALKQLKLENFWPRYDADGKKIADGTVESQKQAAAQ
ncbi:MAG TPA: ABC transporter substrate-binding protein [Terriglobia bacterium]|nr:ABC transporter substrate-binding protein [Terriglobia bacterium]